MIEVNRSRYSRGSPSWESGWNTWTDSYRVNPSTGESVFLRPMTNHLTKELVHGAVIG